MTYAFSFDASACSGCKACQVACKDKNLLPLGVLWRRIYEVGGGEWTHSGNSWTSTVYAYTLSMACNHCVHPKCAGVCPVDAFSVREDGIVLLDSSKCIGCGYCAWACPYGAPQYDPTTGCMTKCNLCYDNLDANLPPACVSACPMRVLDLADQSELEARGLRYQAEFPMPTTSRTEPRVYVKPHPAASLATHPPQLFNQEEYAPQRKHSPGWAAWEEIPLLAFTLLGQMSAGISWVLGVLILLGIPFPPFLYLIIGGCLGLGLVLSFLHLGRPRNAWRVLRNLHKSWLSREILAVLLFATFWAISIISFFLHSPLAVGQSLLVEATGLAGIAFVYCMSEVYRLRMVPAWNTMRIKVSFFLSALILGFLMVLTGSVVAGMLSRELTPLLHWSAVAGIFSLGLELAFTVSEKGILGKVAHNFRILLTAFGIIAAALLLLLPLQSGKWIVLLVFLLTLLEEIIGRWQFYASRNPSM
jgi:anaerobic dimethyl sulfoxide reductase subunit B (iron-sulfur subunit)